MADNVTVGGVSYSTDDVTTLNGATISAGTAQTQRMKNQYGDDGTARDVSDAFPMPTRQVCGTATLTSVAASATSVTVIAANANRRGLILHATTGSAQCYVRLGATAASAALGGHTFDCAAGAMYEVPYGYTGEVRAIWSAATGGLNVTELT